MTTTWDLFHGAALALVGAGTVKQRLAFAYRQFLFDLDPESLPRELRNDYQWLSEKLTSGRAVGGLGVVEATVRKMSDPDATRCAERIVEMFSVLTETATQSHVARTHGLRAVKGGG
jgi:hypothetical protein